MKNFTKLLALALAFVGAGVGTAQAQVLVTSTMITDNSSTPKTILPDGSYVYFLWTKLNDSSYSNVANVKYYFNGATKKNTDDAPVADNYFKVIYDNGATTFKLQRATDGLYVTVASSGTSRTVSMSSTGGSSFSLKALTKSGDMTNNWSLLSNDEANYLEYMRLVYTEGTTEYYLNCQNKADAAKFYTGTGCYSICRMYKVPGSVELHSANSKHYATGYYPVNMTVGEGTTAYYGAITEGTDGTKVVQMTAYTDNIIPANQGALLVSESSSTATLTPTTSGNSVTGNCLGGTSVGITADKASNYYVFGYNENSGVGFYHPNSTSLAAFKAYILATSLSSNVQALSLSFDDEATSISTVETETNTNAPIYDLSGRRVVKATKGLYIQGGKKVYLK